MPTNITVLEAIRADHHHAELIANAVGCTYAEVLTRLKVLEAEGLVKADHTQTFSTYWLVENG